MSGPTAQDLQPRAQAALASSPVFALREVRVEHLDGALLLSGQVSSYYHKQLAQEAIRAVDRTVRIVNSILVEPGRAN